MKAHKLSYFITLILTGLISWYGIVETLRGGYLLFLVVWGILFGIGLIVITLSMQESKKQVARSRGSREEQNEARIVLASDSTLKEWLDARIVGQKEAIEDIVKTLSVKTKKQERTGEALPVLGTFLFVGQTGVGKTETAKAIAEWFNAKYGHQFLQFDMGNFTDYTAASTLVGSPKGYIGSEEGGALTRPLMQNPKAVILFDEMEKAHPSLYKPLMRLIDEGMIQEMSTGQYARLHQGIVIFTSNLFQGTIREISKSMLDSVEKELLIRDVLTGKFDKALKVVSRDVLEKDLQNAQGNGFPPEFIGRIDKIVVFKPLKEMDLVEIAARVMATNGIPVDMKYAYQLTQKYRNIANEYGVRVFVKKIEEEILR